MRLLLLAACCICTLAFISSVRAQNLLDDTATPFVRNSVYIEAFGSGLDGTLNYERRYSENFSLRFGGGIGFGKYIPVQNYIPAQGSDFPLYRNVVFLSFTTSANYWINFGSSHIKIGFGASAYDSGIDSVTFSNGILGRFSGTHLWITGSLCYQYQPREGGIMLEAAFTPLYDLGNRFVPYAGIGAGYAF